MTNPERIDELDGLRVVAIIMVMIFHFYPRFLGVFYEYTIEIPKVLNYGYLGVQLFFIISGFVITLTLTKCSGFVEFMKKRFLRLIPGMVICSVLTFIVMSIFDSSSFFNQSKSVSNLLISNTFISPDLINTVLNTNYAYIDGAYWSLWAELQFYILAAVLYFAAPAQFIRNYSILAFTGVILFFVFFSTLGSTLMVNTIGNDYHLKGRLLFQIFNLFQHNLWFLIGIIVHHLYFVGKSKFYLKYLLFVFVFQMGLLVDLYAISFTVIILITFLLFLYKRSLLSFLANTTLHKVGVASYSIYLIHQHVGVVAINRLSGYFGTLNWMIPILLIILFCVFGVLSYKYFERPLGVKLKKILFMRLPWYYGPKVNKTKI